jgi:hypothetical protein
MRRVRTGFSNIASTHWHAHTRTHTRTPQASTNLHALEPPHTPQLSTVTPLGQHMPDGGSTLSQQTPVASTATPVPLHTPHASTRPPLQQRPARSTAVPLPVQHLPVAQSTDPMQHMPSTSTTPPRHGDPTPLGTTARVPQSSPVQLDSHTHARAAPLELQTQLGPNWSWHISSEEHGAGRMEGGRAHVLLAWGRSDGGSSTSHAASGTEALSASTQVTARYCIPKGTGTPTGAGAPTPALPDGAALLSRLGLCA